MLTVRNRGHAGSAHRGLKKDYPAGAGGSLNLVVVRTQCGGCDNGENGENGDNGDNGKRTNVHGVWLLACYDADAEEYQTMCKIETGFSDEARQAQHDTVKSRGNVNVGGAKLVVLVEPKVVREVRTARRYSAAQTMVRVPCRSFSSVRGFLRGRAGGLARFNGYARSKRSCFA